MTIDFNRPFIDSMSLPEFITDDAEVVAQYGAIVRAVEMSNVDYSIRHRKLLTTRKMRPPPLDGRIFAGYPVVRNMVSKKMYETWMPGHVFEEVYRPISPTEGSSKLSQA